MVFKIGLLCISIVLMIGLSSVVHADTVTFVDTSEIVTVLFNGNLPGPGDIIAQLGEIVITRMFEKLVFPPANAIPVFEQPNGTFTNRLGVVLTEPDTGEVSDFVVASVSGAVAKLPFGVILDTGVRDIFFTFFSDPNVPLDDRLLRALVAGGFAIEENPRGNTITAQFRDAGGTLTSVAS